MAKQYFLGTAYKAEMPDGFLKERRQRYNDLMKYKTVFSFDSSYQPKKGDNPDVDFLIWNFFLKYPEMNQIDGSLVRYNGDGVDFCPITEYLESCHRAAIEYVVDDWPLSTELDLVGRAEWLAVVDFWHTRVNDFKKILIGNWPNPVGVGMGGTLYRCWDGSELLYIGESKTKMERIASHASDSWWCQVNNITIEHFATKADAKVAEIEAIENEKPKYNINHNRNEKRKRNRKCLSP